MRTRLVFWGTNDKSEKVLLALRLKEDDNEIEIIVFPSDTVSEQFAEQLKQDWRSGQDILFPEPHSTLTRPLSISNSILPDGYKVERDDILKRAQTEWHFVVLSSKLFRAYQTELDEIKEQVSKLSSFDSAVWEDLKGFWSKVQEQTREKNLFKEHAHTIRTHTNELFDELKELRKKVDLEFRARSEEQKEAFKTRLSALQQKVNDGLSLNPIFQELKVIQREFKDVKFTSSHRRQVWKQLDGLFKEVKEKKYGPESEQKSNAEQRIKKRYDGLLNAITRMEKSIARDRKEITFQNQRAENADGSLEAQLRTAKIAMVEERIRSKEEKLGDMLKTRTQLEKQIAKIAQREKAKQDKVEIAKAKEALKAKIASDIKQAEKTRDDAGLSDTITKLQEAAEPIVTEVSEGLEEVVDTVKAVATVLEDRFGSFVSQLRNSAVDGKSEEE